MSVITYKWAQGPRIISHNMSSWPGASMRSLRYCKSTGRVWFTYFEFGHMAVFSYDPALCCDMILAPLIREPVSSVLSKQWRCGSQETRHSPSQKAAQSLNNATNLTAMQNCMCVNCIFGALRNATIKSSWHVFWWNCSLWHISLRRVPSHVLSVLYFYSLAHWASLGWVGAFLLVWCFVSRLSQGSPGRMSLQ